MEYTDEFSASPVPDKKEISVGSRGELTEAGRA